MTLLCLSYTRLRRQLSVHRIAIVNARVVTLCDSSPLMMPYCNNVGSSRQLFFASHLSLHWPKALISRLAILRIRLWALPLAAAERVALPISECWIASFSIRFHSTILLLVVVASLHQECISLANLSARVKRFLWIFSVTSCSGACRVPPS